MDDRQKRVAERAFDLWDQQGRPEGRGYENWLQAEREVLGESSEPLADADIEARRAEAKLGRNPATTGAREPAKT